MKQAYWLLSAGFIILKLCKAIEWEWIWVLSPLWGVALAFWLAFSIVGLAYFLETRKIDKLYFAEVVESVKLIRQQRKAGIDPGQVQKPNIKDK